MKGPTVRFVRFVTTSNGLPGTHGRELQYTSRFTMDDYYVTWHAATRLRTLLRPWLRARTTQRACSLLLHRPVAPAPSATPAGEDAAAVFESAPDACPTPARRCRPDAASTACVGLSMPKQLL